MSKWLKQFLKEERQLHGDIGDKGDTLTVLGGALSPLSPCHYGVTEENTSDLSNNSSFSSLGDERTKQSSDKQNDEIKLFDNEHYIKQCYKTNNAIYVENGSSESEAQHQELNNIVLRFIDLTQFSQGSTEVQDYMQWLYKICGIPMMRDP